MWEEDWSWTLLGLKGLTESEIITRKSQTKTLMYTVLMMYLFMHQGRGLRFPCNGWTDKVNNLQYLLCGLFIMDLTLGSILKPTTGQWITLKKTRHNELCTWAHDTVRWHWSADTPFYSCQLIITWMAIRMSTIKVNTDCICLGHLATNAQSLQESNNAQSLQENSQSECMYYCSHIISVLIIAYRFIMRRFMTCLIPVHKRNPKLP